MLQEPENSNLPARRAEQCALHKDDRRPSAVAFSALDPYQSSLRMHLAVLGRRKWTLIAAVAAVFGATCLLCALSPRVYEATATVLVSEPASKAPGGSTGPDQVQLMVAALSAPDIETHATLLQGRSTAVAASAWLKEHSGPALTAAEVERSLRATVVPRTHLIRLTARASSPGDARELANATVGAYTEMNRRRAQGSAESASEYLGEQLTAAKDNLATAEEALRDFKESTKTLAPDAAAGELLGRVASLRADVGGTKADLVQAQERLREVRAQLDQQNKSIAASQVRDNGVVQGLRARLVELQGERLLLESQYTSAFSAPLDQVDEQIRIVKDQLNSEIRNVVRGSSGRQPRSHRLHSGAEPLTPTAPSGST